MRTEGTLTPGISSKLLFIALAAAVLSPYLMTGYYVDDAPNSLLPAYLKLRGLGIGEFIVRENQAWMLERGRLYPLALALAYGSWFWIRSLLLYRWLQITLVVSNLLLFGSLIQALGGSRRLAWLCALLTLSFFQLRNYHDPIASYSFLMQFALALGAGSILLYSRYQKTGRTWPLAASFCLYACTLLLYETGLAFFPVLLFLALRPPRPESPKYPGYARYGAALITALYLGTVGYLRFAYPLAYNGTRSHLGLRALATFFRQLSGALPLVYEFFGKSGFYTFGTLLSREFLTPATLGIFLVGSWVFHEVLRSSEPPEGLSVPARRSLGLLGWTLLVIPSALVAVSEKYQEGIDRPGMAYLPVYLSYFGFALLAGLLLTRARRVRAASVLLGALLAFSYSTNQIAADHLNAYWKNPREQMESAIRMGLLEDVEPGARLLRAECDAWNWANPEFMLSNTGKAYASSGLEEGLREQPTGAPVKTYVVVQKVRGPGEGQVLLAPLDHAEWDKNHEKVSRIFTAGRVKIIDFAGGIGQARLSRAREIGLLSKEAQR